MEKRKMAEFKKRDYIFEVFVNEENGEISVTMNGENETVCDTEKSRRTNNTWCYDVASGTKIAIIATGKKDMNLLLSDPSAETVKTESRRIAKAKKEEENQKEYAHLMVQLPEIRYPENTPDQAKYNEIMGKISNLYFSGPEDDGLNINIAAGNGRIRNEAKKYCDHDWVIEYVYGTSPFYHLELTRNVTCKNCGYVIQDKVADPPTYEEMMR
jgi:hypothetical protein